MINKKKFLIYTIMVIFIIIVLILNFLKKDDKYEQITFNEILETSNVKETKVNENELDTIKVHIIGEVKAPGLIELDVGSRIADAIELANGLTENADITKTNLAYILSDGEKIYIPNKNDENTEELQETNKKININVATVSDLENIPGVGESTANSIVEYRNKNGKFSIIEDIKNVSGIGESKFEKMKDFITVK